jgi:Predicted ATP-dependent serine protease
VDPACDLAVVCAVLASNFDFAVPSDVCFAGEVGLSGEIRPVNQIDRRIAECARLGFKKIYISKFASYDKNASKGIEVVKLADVPALVRSVFKN